MKIYGKDPQLHSGIGLQRAIHQGLPECCAVVHFLKVLRSCITVDGHPIEKCSGKKGGPRSAKGFRATSMQGDHQRPHLSSTEVLSAHSRHILQFILPRLCCHDRARFEGPWVLFTRQPTQSCGLIDRLPVPDSVRRWRWRWPECIPFPPNENIAIHPDLSHTISPKSCGNFYGRHLEWMNEHRSHNWWFHKGIGLSPISLGGRETWQKITPKLCTLR